LFWVGLGQSADGLGWIGATQNGPIDNSDTIRCDTRCYFNVRSKALIVISRLNLSHGTNNWKVGKK